MKKIFYPYLLCLGVITNFGTSCSKDETVAGDYVPTIAPAPAADPLIVSISPDSGAATSQITLHGQNFGTEISMDTLWFNGGSTPATINIATDSVISATVPTGVATDDIVLSVYGKHVTGPVYKYVPFTMNYTLGYSGPTTYAGTSGTTTSADGKPGTFRAPRGAAIDVAGNIYIGEMSDNIIRKITTDGNVTTIGVKTPSSPSSTDGTLTTATFNAPRGVAVDRSGNLIVVETSGNRVRKVNFNTGLVSTIAGTGATGTGATATFSSPQGVIVDSKGVIYVADGGTHTIKRIVLDANDNATVTIVAGTSGSSGHVDGIGTTARFSTPLGIAVDASDNLLVSDYGLHYIRYVNTTTWAVTTLAGTGTAGAANATDPLAASFSNPAGIAVDLYGNIIVTDYGTGNLRLINGNTHAVTTIGSGLINPVGVTTDASGNVYTSGYGNKLIQKFTLSVF